MSPSRSELRIKRTYKQKPYINITQNLLFKKKNNTYLSVEPLQIIVQLILQILLVGEIIDQHDFVQDMLRRTLQHRVHRSHQHGETLIVEDDNHARCGQIVRIVPVFAFRQSSVLDGTFEGDFIRAGHIHAVLHFAFGGGILFVLGDRVGHTVFAGTLSVGQVGGFEIS